MENDNLSSFKKIIITFILGLIIQLVIGVIIGVAFGIYYGITNPNLDQDDFSLLIKNSFYIALVTLISAESIYLIMAFILKSKNEPIVNNKFSFKNLNLQLLVSIIGFALCFIFISAEIENIIALIVGRPESQGLIAVLAKIEGLSGFFIAVALMVFLPAITEEILFRGIIQSNLITKFGIKKGIVITSILFSIIHLYPSVLVPIFLLSLMLGYLYSKTNNLFYPILLHILNNLIVVILIRNDTITIAGLIKRGDVFEHVNVFFIVPSLLLIVLIVLIIKNINHPKSSN